MSEPCNGRIPRVMDLRGTYKGGGGPDKTVLNSAAQHDPGRVYVLVTYLRQPQDHEFQIPEMARQAKVPNFTCVTDGGMIDRSCLAALRQLLVEHRIDLLHAHDDKTLLYGWLLRRMVPSLRIMYTCHSHAVYGRNEFNSWKGYLSFKVRQRVQIWLMQRYPKPVITVSQDTKKRLTRNGLEERGVAVLHNGIDTAFWQRDSARPVLRRELALPEGCLLVGTVARITYDKDLPTFYRVAEEVAKRHGNVRFVIVGDGYGGELAEARREVARRGLDRLIHFTGHRNDLRDVYGSFDIFLMTSLTEGLPNTLLEAMAMGVPAVSTSVGGIPELLEHGVDGFLAPVGDAGALAAGVTRLIEDRELLESCSVASRGKIEARFSFGQRVRRMEDYYDLFSSGHPAAV